MNRKLLFCGMIAISIVVEGCAVTVPIAAKIGDTSFMGDATGKITGDGSYSISSIDGVTCTGTYDSLDPTLTIRSLIKCSDGRSGAIMIVRNRDLKSGIGQGRLSDGTPVKFGFGAMAAMIGM